MVTGPAVAVDGYHRVIANVAQGHIVAQTAAVPIPVNQQRRHIDMIPLRNREILPGIAAVAAGIVIGQQSSLKADGKPSANPNVDYYITGLKVKVSS